MSFSKVAVGGLALVSAVSGFNAGMPGFALRPATSSSLTSLSMSGIANSKSVKPDDSRRGGIFHEKCTYWSICFVFSVANIMEEMYHSAALRFLDKSAFTRQPCLQNLSAYKICPLQRAFSRAFRLGL
jgi:hypothetical protein